MTREVEARLKISAVDRTGRVLKTVGDKLDYIDKRAQAYNRTMSATGRTGQAVMMGLARVAGPAILGAAFAKGAKDAVVAAATFEEALFGIQKKSGATAEQMAKLVDEIKGLATEMPVSIEEIASAFERGAAAGIPLEELREFAKLTAGVADAWDTSAENVGNIFAGFNVGLGIARKDLASYASLINDLADSGIADETGIADFVDRVGASLKNFGMTPEEIAAYGAAMLNLKMPAEVGARAMDTLTGKLAAPENLSPKSRKALGAIVGDLDKFGKLAGNQKLTFFLKQLDKMTGQRRTSLLGALLGEGFDDEITRLVAGVEEVERNLDLARKHVANPSTSIVDAQVKKLDLFNSQLKIMQGHFDVMATNIGEDILPAFTETAKAINDLLKQAEDQKKATKGLSWEEEQQQRQQFIDDWKENNPEQTFLPDRKAIAAYGEALAAEGRGEIKDVHEYNRHQADLNRYINGQNRSSSVGPDGKPTGRTSMPVRFYREPEFPGGDHNIDPYNLPLSGVPVPGNRNAPSKQHLQNLQDQYLLYGNGRATAADAANAEIEILHSKVKAVMSEMNSQSSGSAPWLDDAGQQAGRSIADGGNEAAEAMKQAAAGFQSLLREMSALTSRLSSIKIPSSPSGGVRVNADTGPSMPPMGPGGRPF